MTYLLDVNVLIALLDEDHVHHDKAFAWQERNGRHAWATCPITENGAVRILGNRGYPGGPGSPAEAAALLADLSTYGEHAFWADDYSLVAEHADTLEHATKADDVTDVYLLGLAVRHGGKLATFDRRIPAAAVRGGADALVIID